MHKIVVMKLCSQLWTISGLPSNALSCYFWNYWHKLQGRKQHMKTFCAFYEHRNYWTVLLPELFMSTGTIEQYCLILNQMAGASATWHYSYFVLFAITVTIFLFYWFVTCFVLFSVHITHFSIPYKLNRHLHYWHVYLHTTKSIIQVWISIFKC